MGGVTTAATSRTNGGWDRSNRRSINFAIGNREWVRVAGLVYAGMASLLVPTLGAVVVKRFCGQVTYGRRGAVFSVPNSTTGRRAQPQNQTKHYVELVCVPHGGSLMTDTVQRAFSSRHLRDTRP